MKNKPLFDDDIVAVKNGPIIPTVYKKFNKFKHAPIDKTRSYDPAPLSKEQKKAKKRSSNYKVEDASKNQSYF